MKPITRSDLLPVEEYRKVQPQFLKKVVEEKKVRRVRLNEYMSGLFENRLTVWYQIQEMIRAENITKQEYIDEMLEVYNDLIPSDHELSMTLFIEIPNQVELRRFNRTIVGIEKAVLLEFAENQIVSYENDSDEEGNEGYTQSIHYLKFPFTAEQINEFQNHSGGVIIRINHPNFQSETILPDELVQTLKKDLG